MTLAAQTPRPRSAPTAPVGPRRIPGGAPDGRRWELVVEPSAVTVVMSDASVAEAHVWEPDEEVVVEFWVDGPDLPDPLSTQLVEQAFAHPAVRADRPILVCAPRQDGALVHEARRRIAGARTRAAGTTCLMEGRVSNRPAVPRPRAAGR
ncbi:hypothetical protein ACI79D_07655 [Geodermatophilus sp. SYSU D00708]